MNGRKLVKRFLSLLLALMMALTLAPVSAEAEGNSDTPSLDYRIVHLDCGRKYFSVDNIKSIIDTSSEAGFNYLELAVGNDGLRFLLDDMSVTVGETAYESTDVTNAVQAANKAYYDAGEQNELTQAEMDEIIAYAKEKGMGVIPLLNTPGHMNAIVSAMASLGINGSYDGSANTIDVTNADAVAFTKALLQKYVTYFAEKGCTLFNFGADEYANDIYSTGGMGFAQLVNAGQYDEFVAYINDLAAMIKDAGMIPMAFNDGIYYNRDTSNAIDTDIMVTYWSSGWSGYNVASASFLADQGFKMINTHGDYYWVLGKTDAQCSAEKAAGFDATAFMGNSTISDPAGAMFCIWCDVPGADTADSIVANTKDTITAFGRALTGTTEGGSGNESGTPDGKVTDENTGISIQADGLNGLEVSKKESASVTIFGAVETAAYDIVPSVDNEAYTGEAKVSIPVPSDWNLSGKILKGFVVNDDESYILLNGTLNEDQTIFTFTCPHFSEAGIVLLDVTEKTITVTAGGTYTDTIGGVNLSGNSYSADDPSVVSIEVTGSDGTPERTTYSEADVNCDDLISINSSSWQQTDYYYRVGENYYPLYAQRSRSGYSRYDYTWGYSTTGSSDNVVECGTDNYVRDWSNPSITVYQVSGTTPETPASTTVTFTADPNAAGRTTYATVGDIHYTITVVDASLAEAEPLTVEFWITNSHITTESNGSVNSLTLTADMAGMTSDEGLLIEDLVPASGYRGTDGAHVYWRTRLLDRDTDEQTAASGDNECMDGTGIVRVRYDIDTQTWQAYTEAGEWMDVADTTNTNQIVAYYMKTMDIKNATTGLTEVYAMAADWGAKADGTEQTYSGDNEDAATVSIQIVYEDNSTNPGGTDASDLKSYTFTYDHWDPRGLGTVGFVAANGYQIYRVTAETGEVWNTNNRQQISNGYFNAGHFEWDDNEETVWESETPMATAAVSNPNDSISFDAPLDNLTWDWRQHNDNNAILLRVYVRAVATEDSLNVHYIDNASGTEFYDYSIAVAEGTYFDTNIGLNADGSVVNGTVINYIGAEQTVSSDLSTMPQISAAYRDRQWDCVRLERRDDKNVYLYYDFTDTHTVVYDYGLPISITADTLGLQNASTITAGTALYGNVTVNDDNSVTYTPNTMSPQVEDVALTAAYAATDETQETTTTTYLHMVPATTVYYEDDDSNFITFSDGWTTTGKTADNTQTYNTTPYGYDAAYAGSGYYSNGSAHTVNIAEGGESQTATFTFTGTGFDLYSQTGENNGLLSIKVVNDSGETVKNTSVQNTGNDTLYQIPVYTVKNLTYDTYTVTVTAFAAYTNEYYPSLSQGGYHVIDAVQIYNPLTAEGTQYQADNEANAVRLKIRDAIIDAETYNSADGSGNGVLYINADSVEDNGGVIDYTLVGPNNEAYLNSMKSMIGFILETSSPVATLQIGAKSADGQPVTMNVTVNGESNSAAINTATAMNYKLENLGTPGNDNSKYQYTIYISKSGGEGILSITDVKATFASSSDAEFKYTKAVAEGATVGTATQAEAAIQENGVTVTTNRVRYGRTMTMEVVTTNALVDGQSFTVRAGSRTYSVGESGLNALTVSDGKQNSDGTYTYTLQLMPYTYKLFGNTNFVISLTGSNGTDVVSTQTIAVRVTLL